MQTYNVVDLFAGAGGLSLGFIQTGRVHIVAAAENNPNATVPTKALLSKRKPSNRFVMHPKRKVGAFSPSGFQADSCCGNGGEGRRRG